MYLLDLWRKQAASDVWVEAFCDLVKQWKPIGWAEEQGQIKSGVGPFLEKRQRERKAYVSTREQFPTRGDKAVRAQSIRGRMALEGLYVPINAPWYPILEANLLSFPAGKHDDQVDALGLVGQLLDKMMAGKSPASPRSPRTLSGYKRAGINRLNPMIGMTWIDTRMTRALLYASLAADTASLQCRRRAQTTRRDESYWSLVEVQEGVSRLPRQQDRGNRGTEERRRYYHGAQWTEEQIKALNKRKQPVVTFNRIGRKIDGVVGLIERLRQDPKAYPRTPQHEEGAELATAVIRYVLDEQEWKAKSPEWPVTAPLTALAALRSR
jgi:predicted phage terminase large subunit-like protein